MPGYAESAALASFFQNLAQNLSQHGIQKQQDKRATNKAFAEQDLRDARIGNLLVQEPDVTSYKTPEVLLPNGMDLGTLENLIRSVGASKALGQASDVTEPSGQVRPNMLAERTTAPSVNALLGKTVTAGGQRPLTPEEQRIRYSEMMGGKKPSFETAYKKPEIPKGVTDIEYDAYGNPVKYQQKSSSNLAYERLELARDKFAKDVERHGAELTIKAYKDAQKAVDDDISSWSATPEMKAAMVEAEVNKRLAGVNKKTSAKTSFNTVEEAASSGLPVGTKITIGGRPAVIE